MTIVHFKIESMRIKKETWILRKNRKSEKIKLLSQKDTKHVKNWIRSKRYIHLQFRFMLHFVSQIRSVSFFFLSFLKLSDEIYHLHRFNYCSAVYSQNYIFASWTRFHSFDHIAATDRIKAPCITRIQDTQKLHITVLCALRICHT